MGRWSIACAAFSMIAWWWWRRRRARTSSHGGGGNSQMYICFWYRLILCTLKRGNNSWYVSFGIQSWLLHIQSEHAEETTKGQLMYFWCLQFFQKTNLKTLIFALAYWGRNFSFIFWKYWKHKKLLSKLTDLYCCYNDRHLFVTFVREEFEQKLPKYS